MLNLKNIVKDTETIKSRLESRGFDSSIIDKVLEVSQERSKVMTHIQHLESQRNDMSKQIAELKRNGESADQILLEVANIKQKIEEIKNDELNVNKELREMLLVIPNIPQEGVPLGKDENDNVQIGEHIIGKGKIKDVKPHYEIAKELDIVDFERAVKLSGTRFWSYKGLGAKLVRSLENFMLDIHTKKGYTEFRPPIIVKSQMLEGTGQLPKFKEDLFKLEGIDSYLIPTAEVPLTNYFANEIIDLNQPIAFTAFTPCFRSEAGSAGKDTRGLIRAHQFNKVELVKFTNHDDLEMEFAKTLEDAKNILELLELPYRELELCTGDIGFSSQRTVDLEVWLPSEQKYREISSVSIFGEYQARRASIRYKSINGNKYANTINGSGLAIDRTVAAILENYQNEDGSITIPKVLVPYMGIETIE